MKIIRRYYSRNFGFIVCILQRSARYVPIAYVHELKKDGKLFVPVRQHHGFTTDTSFISNSRFYKYHQPKCSAFSESTTTGNTNYGSGYDNESINGYLYDTMLASDNIADDKIIQYQAKKTEHIDISTSNVSREHKIYVINNEKLYNSKLKNTSGIKITYVGNKMMRNISNHIYMGNFPSEITFNNIKYICKVRIEKKYNGNQDLFLEN